MTLVVVVAGTAAAGGGDPHRTDREARAAARPAASAPARTATASAAVPSDAPVAARPASGTTKTTSARPTTEPSTRRHAVARSEPAKDEADPLWRHARDEPEHAPTFVEDRWGEGRAGWREGHGEIRQGLRAYDVDEQPHDSLPTWRSRAEAEEAPASQSPSPGSSDADAGTPAVQLASRRDPNGRNRDDVAAMATERPDPDVLPLAPRRTHLAAERTWLAWWRTGLATAAAALGVGRLAPELIGGETWPYVALGAGYAVLAIALLLMARERERRIRAALNEDSYDELSSLWVSALTAAAVLLAAGTLVLVVTAG